MAIVFLQEAQWGFGGRGGALLARRTCPGLIRRRGTEADDNRMTDQRGREPENNSVLLYTFLYEVLLHSGAY